MAIIGPESLTWLRPAFVWKGTVCSCGYVAISVFCGKLGDE